MEYQDKSFKYTDAAAYDRRGESSLLEKYVLGLWQPFLKDKIAELSADKIVVDWGCGTGEYALAAKRAKRIYCIDISEIMLKKAKEKLRDFKQTEFICGSGFEHEIPANTADLILTIGVWEYVNQAKLFEKIRKLAKAGSKVLVVFPNVYNDLNWMRILAKVSPLGKFPEGRKKVALRPGFIKNLFKYDFTLVESASFGNVFWFPKKLQFLSLPFWKFSDFIWRPFQKLFPLGINIYYLFERK